MSLRWGEERKGRVCEGARGLTLLFSLRRIQGRGNHTFQCPHPQLQLLPPWAPIPRHQAFLVLSAFSIKECHTTTTTTTPLQHFLITTACVTGSDAGLLTPKHASPPQPHCARRRCRRGAGPQTRGLPPSQIFAGAWLAQSSQLWGPALVAMG